MSREAAAAPERPRPSALRVGATLGAVVAAAVVVFGLGVMEGKRVAESAPPVAAPPAALPTEPPAAARPAPTAAAATPEKLTFYDRLSGVTAPAPLPLPEGETPRPASPPGAAADPAAAAPRNPEPPAPAAARAPTPAALPKPAADSAAARIRKLAGKGRYAVQVASVNDRSAAEAAAARVRSEGFDALTVMVSIKGKTWYRIRTGRFPSKQAAIKAAGIFSSAYGFKAIAVQD